MRKLFIVALVLGTASAFAQVNLPAGASITLSGIQVNCLGQTATSGSSAYLGLPNSKLMEILKTQGIGLCKVRPLSGQDFFYSPKYRNGLHLSSNMHSGGAIGFVRSEILAGECE